MQLKQSHPYPIVAFRLVMTSVRPAALHGQQINRWAQTDSHVFIITGEDNVVVTPNLDTGDGHKEQKQLVI